MRLSRLPLLLLPFALLPLLAPSCPPGSDTGAKEDTADTGAPDDTADTGTSPDRDGDGWTKADDCDDDNAKVHPGATELCNGGDDDCDGLVDEDDPDVVDAATYCADADGDGRGDPATSVVSCDHPAGYVTDCSDANDADPGV